MSRISKIITANEVIDICPKSDDDTMMGQMMHDRIADKFNQSYADKGAAADVDWNSVTTIFESVPRENLLPKIADTILQTKSRVSNILIAAYLNNDNRENYIKSVIINLMSTPEYQLC